MLSGNSVMHGRVYQLDCGDGYIKVTLGSDDGYGGLERWKNEYGMH